DQSPNAGHPTLVKRRASPGVVPGLTGPRDQFVTTDLLAVADIVAGHVASEAGHLAGAARDNHAVHDDWATGVLDEEVTPAVALPDPAARTSVEAHDEIVPGGENDFVAVQRDGALALAVDRRELFPRRQW